MPAIPRQIVLSCAPDDIPATRAIAKRLQADGFDLWLTADAGTEPREVLPALRSALRQSAALVVCYSQRAIGPDKKPVATIARLLDLLIVLPPGPYLLIVLKLGVCELPQELAKAQVIELFGYSGYEKLCTTLQAQLAQIKQAAPPPPAPKPEPPPLSPALALRGQLTWPTLERHGQLQRLGSGVARGVYLFDNQQALITSGGGAALIDLASEQELWSIDEPTRAASLAQNGCLLALAGVNRISLWDLRRGQIRAQFSGHAEPISALAFTPDERTLISASHDGTMRLWRTAEDVGPQNALLATVPAHSDHVTSLACSPDGALIASGSADRSVRIWRMLDRALIQTLGGSGGTVEALAFSPDGKTLVAGSRGRGLRIWDTHTWRLRSAIDAHNGAVEAVAFSADSDLFASGAADQHVRLWSASSSNLHRAMGGHGGPITGLSFAPNAQHLAAVGESNQLHIWNTSDGSLAQTLHPLSGRVTSLVFSPSGTQLMIGTTDGNALRYRLAKESIVQRQSLQHRGAISSLAFLAEHHLLSAANDRAIRAHNLSNQNSVILLQTHGTMQHTILATNGQYMASHDGELTIQLWRLAAEQEALGMQFWRALRGLRSRIRLVVFSPQAKAVAVASEDSMVHIWRFADLEKQHDLPKISLHSATGRPRQLAFSPDETHLAIGLENGQTQLWRLSDGQVVADLNGAGRPIVGLAFSPNGQRLASGDSLGTLQLWRIPLPASQSVGKSSQRRRELQQISSISAHAGSLEQLAFGPDGSMLASGSADGTVRLWTV